MSGNRMLQQIKRIPGGILKWKLTNEDNATCQSLKAKGLVNEEAGADGYIRYVAVEGQTR